MDRNRTYSSLSKPLTAVDGIPMSFNGVFGDFVVIIPSTGQQINGKWAFRTGHGPNTKAPCSKKQL
jgi:hypothetical protein